MRRRRQRGVRRDADRDRRRPRTTAAARSGGGATLKFSAPADGSLKFDQKDATAKAGKVTVDFANPRSTPHAVEIEGNGVEEETETVTSGDAPPITVDLKPGTYEFYCPVPGHKEAGMKGTLTVSDAPRHLLVAEGEDRREVAPHQQGVRDLAERPVRQRVADGVAHQRPAAGAGRELVRVVPERVRPGELGVDEALARHPLLDPGQPRRAAARAASAGTRSARPGASRSARGVSTRKPSHGGVIASRLRASAKNGKTSSGVPGSRCSRRSTW